MIVKIGDKLFSSHKEPIMLMLSDSDKRNLQNMEDNARILCVYPDSIPEVYIAAWMYDHLKGESNEPEQP